MGKKSKRLPGAPKLPLNSYMEFFKEERVRIMSEGSATTLEISKIVGERWRKLTDEEKQVYEAKSRENRLMYEEKRRSFLLSRKDNADLSTASYKGMTILT